MNKMAKVGSQSVRIYIGGYDLSPSATRVAVSLVTQALDPTAIVDAGERALAGIRQDGIEYDGIFDNGVLDFDAAQKAILGDGTAVASVHLGVAIGDTAYCGTVLLVSAKPSSKIGELVRQEATFKPDGSLQRGVALTAGTLMVSGVGAQGTIDNAGSSLNGYTWYVQALGTAGTGTAQVNLEHSSDGSGWSQMTNQGGLVANKSYRREGNGTVARYTRLYIDPLQQTSITLVSELIRK